MSEQRFLDNPPYYFDYYQVLRTKGIWLKCPSCGGLAVVKKGEKGTHLTCQHCFKSNKVTKSADRIYSYCYTGICSSCEKYIRYDLNVQPYPFTTMKCPRCGTDNQLTLQKEEPVMYAYSSEAFLEKGIDPLTGANLYFVDSFRGNYFWALNLEHLNYLCEYVASGLRERSPAVVTWRLSAGSTIPKFMKSAKNRTIILKKLERMKRRLL